MTKTIRFFKISEGPERGWFADVPNHTLAENEMVAGCDLFLEAADMLTVRTAEHDGRLRKYYHITGQGRRRIEEFREDWKEIMAIYRFITRDPLSFA